jgi:predicted Zn-dependent protease
VPYRIKTLDISSARHERTYIRLSLGILFGLILLIFVCWGGRRAYVHWQEKRLVIRAATDLQKGDLRSAGLALRTILQLKPSSVPATRLMADLADSLHDKSAVDWRKKVVALAPNSTDDIIAWAKSAAANNDPATAERALQQTPEAGKSLASYHAVAAMVALQRQREKEAETEWKEAVRLEPGNRVYQLQLAMVQVTSPDRTSQAAGERILRNLLGDPEHRAAAARALLSAGVTRHDPSRDLLELARTLQAYPEAKLSDKLIYLDFLHQLNDPSFAAVLTDLEKSVQSNPTDLAALLSWMSRSNLNLLALDYLTTAPVELLEKWPVTLAVADIYLHLGDWKKLEQKCQNTSWERFDFLRHAYLARAFRAQDKPAAAEHEWAAAVKGSSEDSEMTFSLIRTVTEWGWKDETVELFWALSKNQDRRKEALQSLYQYYAQARDTQGLYHVLLRLVEADPGDSDVQNNLAQISLLLDAQPEDARKTAAELYQKNPANAAYATTYAYALLTKGKVQEAQKIMNSLSETQLREPAVSAYYGLCLAAAKDPRAHEFLEAGRKGSLLPQEEALVEKALGRISP